MVATKLLVTGISGLLGSNLARVAVQAGFNSAGTYQQHRVEIEGVQCIELTLEDLESAARLVDELRPALVIHGAAMSRPDDCAKDPARCRLVNVDSTRTLARATARIGSQFLFLSSDLVYGNRTGELVETMAAQPVGVYAGSKLLAEQAALEETAGAACIARTSLIYGWGSGATLCTFEEWLQALRTGQRIRAFTDQWRCPTYVLDLARALLLAGSGRLSGVYNVAGPTFCTRFDFATAMAREFGLDESLIEPFRIDAFGYSDPRPNALNLSIAKLQAAVPYQPLDLAEALRELRQGQPDYFVGDPQTRYDAGI